MNRLPKAAVSQAPSTAKTVAVSVGVYLLAVPFAIWLAGYMFCIASGGGFLCGTSGFLLGPILAYPLTLIVVNRWLSKRWMPANKKTWVALAVSLVLFIAVFKFVQQ